ncbi:MAG: hypothetical protein HYU39_09230 [Thaumarchaeota archaeon]|nr:hypothetical protein [Nitrososphaerota archaeon]
MPDNRIDFPVYTEENGQRRIDVTIERTDTDTATVTLQGGDPSPIQLSNVTRSQDGTTLTGNAVADFTRLADRVPALRDILQRLRLDIARVEFTATITVDCDSDPPTFTVQISRLRITLYTLTYTLDSNDCTNFIEWVRNSPIPQPRGWWKKKKPKTSRRPASTKRLKKRKKRGARRSAQA